jgi:hypothetical protein
VIKQLTYNIGSREVIQKDSEMGLLLLAGPRYYISYNTMGGAKLAAAH